jgi:leucyl/phenylalanyl-tRNA--protein transferase
MTAPVFDCDAIMQAYGEGAFPMAESRDAKGFAWYTAPMRSVLPIDLHIPKSLKKLMAKAPFTITTDRAFEDVITACGGPRQSGTATWINADLIHMMVFLHKKGIAHSVECWQGDQLAGGLYGIVQGAVFNGESMFSTLPGASKIALVHLCRILKAGGFQMLDTQFINPHMLQFGGYEIPHARYMALLHRYRNEQACFKGIPAL